MRNSFKRLYTQDAYERALSATFTHGNGRRNVHTAVLTLDDALDLIDKKNRQKATLVRRAEERGGPTLKQEMAQAKFRAANTTKVKMPVFSIQQIDVDKIGAA